MLHGEVKVNDDEIGKWSAVRKDKLHNRLMPDDEVHEYEYAVTWKDKKTGEFINRQGVVSHRYGNSPFYLLALILEDAL